MQAQRGREREGVGAKGGEACPEDAQSQPTTPGSPVGMDIHTHLNCLTAGGQRKQTLPGGRYWQCPEEFTNTLV